ncbi:RtcB family protein [Oscillochloris sp. ZM17-4]|uniref:RtcB family protein n=1 Tax=Oscillochloris sp. ZM17-4 TaxID=2866714 RepID=UPI00210402FB|nr:RtcB family protein [Oscillochloris sp. ZM17-4]
MSMKPHQLIAPWKGDKRFTTIAKRAAALKKDGHDAEGILAAVRAEFGAPPELLGLREQPAPAAVFGTVGADVGAGGADIEPGALAQLQLALRLPIADRGALMPDAHVGYALPIGGVFRAHRAVAPAMVGVDIACRMMLTVFETPPDELLRRRDELFGVLKSVTTFGAGAPRPYKADHAVLDDPRWGATGQLRGLRQKAADQLGTSGSGNHFAELVVGERLQELLPGAPAHFAGLLTHSGSRGVGYAVANHYMRVAAQETARVAKVPRYYEWLDLDSEAGQEYWTAMELCGAYASANHHVIHDLFARRGKLPVAAQVENHHNFAWREGDMVVHRKGATPAEAGVLGLIPGSMGTSSYVVAGKGSPDSLMSTSHGAGRRGSRTWAKNTIAMGAVRHDLAARDILVEGLSADESPLAYKDIERVIALQEAAGLLEKVARMRPVAVLMAGEPGED